MRRSEKEIKDKSVIVDLLNTCHIGRLGTIGKNGYPMVKPLNFAYNPPIPPFRPPLPLLMKEGIKGRLKGGEGGFGTIYFHTAKEGEKIEDIKRDSKVCFEVDLPIAYIKAKNNPCQADYLFRSVIIKGRANIVEDRDEKLFALKCLMEKHQPEGGYGDP
jgi:nitroimidazol reductase NimA-like FMN-containing flavoprotein (pyridoxamine 5'-phosphate oxidase superfamily)